MVFVEKNLKYVFPKTRFMKKTTEILKPKNKHVFKQRFSLSFFQTQIRQRMHMPLCVCGISTNSSNLYKLIESL